MVCLAFVGYADLVLCGARNVFQVQCLAFAYDYMSKHVLRRVCNYLFQARLILSYAPHLSGREGIFRSSLSKLNSYAVI